MIDGFVRIAACSPRVSVAGVEANVEAIISLMKSCAAEGADLVVFPELSVSAYTCGDLFHQSTLLEAVNKGLKKIEQAAASYPASVFVVGAPVYYGGALYNCAVIITGRGIAAYVPKTYLPNYNEFYERRWFESGAGISGYIDGVPFGTDMILNLGKYRLGAEICEDLWVPVPPSCNLAMAGADVIVNLSASDDLIGKYSYLEQLISQQSARTISAYAYASAGFGESSTDLVFNSKLFIAENGKILKKNDRWQKDEEIIMADVDIEAIRRDRLHLNSFATCRRNNSSSIRIVDVAVDEHGESRKLNRFIDPEPFVPSGPALAERCEEILNIQTLALAKRLEATHCNCLTIGISGGLDSTLALLVAVKAFDYLGLDRAGIIGVTMPGFGTTKRTHSNAVALMEYLGVTAREIPIGNAVTGHFADIGHDPDQIDVTYENCQARERTQVLMDLANELGGMVLGTGDLSELALGWATYNGDHMSMYAVNAGVPKTLVRHLTRFVADSLPENDPARTVLNDIIDTPISPELKPADEKGDISQKTEDLVGPYILHDFFLYYVLRFGFSPRRIYELAKIAFEDKFDAATIKKWLRIFFRRFFAQQFKRSCLPDGPKVGSVCLSPRGDWRMPSDASSQAWLKELDDLE